MSVYVRACVDDTVFNRCICVLNCTVVSVIIRLASCFQSLSCQHWTLIWKKSSLWRFASWDNVPVSAWGRGPFCLLLCCDRAVQLCPPIPLTPASLRCEEKKIRAKGMKLQKKTKKHQQRVSWILNARGNNWKTNKTNRIKVKLVLPAIGHDCLWSVVQL